MHWACISLFSQLLVKVSASKDLKELVHLTVSNASIFGPPFNAMVLSLFHPLSPFQQVQNLAYPQKKLKITIFLQVVHY